MARPTPVGDGSAPVSFSSSSRFLIISRTQPTSLAAIGLGAHPDEHLAHLRVGRAGVRDQALEALEHPRATALLDLEADAAHAAGADVGAAGLERVRCALERLDVA